MEQKYVATLEKCNGRDAIVNVEYSNESSSILFMMNLIIQEVMSKFSINPSSIKKIEICKENKVRRIKIFI